MPFDLYTLAEKLSDDASIELNGERYSGAEIKQFAANQRDTIKQREDAIASERAQREAVTKRFEQFETSTSALLRAAAAEAARDDGSATNGNNNHQAAATYADPEFQTYEQDPLFGPYTKVLKKKMMTDLDGEYFRPWVEKQLNPVVDGLRRQNEMLSTMLIDERQHREYRDLGEWPDKFDLNHARNYGNERGYFIPNTTRQDPTNGRTVGIVDLNRVHGDVMGPIIQSKRDKEREQEITERVTRELRMNANVINMPNRTLGGPPPVKPRGKTAEEILSNSLNEAVQDPETQRALMSLRG